ncbi:hypothetical protein NW762_008946 [Fusarium torreyae]|uniref:Amino acid transporter transmembrane domain-containing protein n=1 Tax=Fusarium torreyae TaxID=1237075 RepID=A0A9W8RWF4_9HYPO|nr:hypothetical protein NW762_008946 [Fusarium torreyae]
MGSIDNIEADNHQGNIQDVDDKSLKGGEMTDAERQITEAGEAKFHRLGWKRLTIVLIVEAIALGALSLPAAFATLGMVAGVICCVSIGFLALYASYVIGQVKLRYPQVHDYADAGRLLMGSFGYWLFSAMFALQVTFVTSSHCLTGTIALRRITQSDICTQVFGAVSAIILLILAIPPSFTDLAILGYIDFASILAAIGVTIISTGIQAHSHTNGGSGSSEATWSAWPKEGVTLTEAFVAICSIVFAYSFATCQFSFMDEMHTPQDYVKSIWTLGLTEIVLYTITGSTIYAFVGPNVKAPALLSASPLISRIVFGLALPVIFISGSINTVVIGRYIHRLIYKNSLNRYINTKSGWATWLAVITAVTILAWLLAEAIPVFEDLLSLASALFTSGFSFYIPAVMWFVLIRKDSWLSRRNLFLTSLNLLVFATGAIVLILGLYATIQDIIDRKSTGETHGSFTCSQS